MVRATDAGAPRAAYRASVMYLHLDFTPDPRDVARERKLRHQILMARLEARQRRASRTPLLARLRTTGRRPARADAALGV